MQPGAIETFHRLRDVVDGMSTSIGRSFGYVARDPADIESRGHRKWVERPPHSTTIIELTEELELPFPYVEVTSKTPEDASVVLAELAAKLDTIALTELQKEAAKGLDQRHGLLLLIAIATNDVVDDATSALVGGALGAADVETRADAAMAAAMLKWPVLRAPLVARMASEADPGIRRLLEHALGLLENE
jgi:hypothetical protein